nr:ribonuclease J [Clostridia bacterium]
ARLAEELGEDPDNIFVLGNGDILYLTENEAFCERDMVPSDAILVDGLGVGDVGNIVLRDRKNLSKSGLVIVCFAVAKEGYVVSGPEIVSRGFVYVKEHEDLIEAAKEVSLKAVEQAFDDGLTDWAALKSRVRDELSRYITEVTKRSPIILPIFLEV